MAPCQREGNRDCSDWVASGEEDMEEWSKNRTEEGWGLREKEERGRRERSCRSTGTQGCLFSALPRDVTDMLTWPTPCPSPSRHPAQPWPLGPPSWSQGRRCGVGCVSRHNTDPTAWLKPWLSPLSHSGTLEGGCVTASMAA